MKQNEYIELAEQKLIHTYNRYPIVLDRGDGMYLYDIEGKKYLDFCGGIAVFALGYYNQEFNDALKHQIDKLLHTSNYYYNVPAIEAAEKLTNAAGMDKVFFTNSGAEAIEGALKLAVKYGYQKTGTSDHEIIALDHSFHGRTMGALSLTGNPKYQEAFKPLIGGIKFAQMNDLESVKKSITDKTCAIFMETIQGEGGIHPATESFYEGVRALCNENDMLMICDEIQCGMGRTGKMFAYQYFPSKPDVVTSAKALGCGVPIGAFLVNDKAGSVLTAGDHGTTYGGNPFATAAASKVLDMFEKYDILSNVNNAGAYLERKLDAFVAKYDFIKERRGKGLMQGLELNQPVGGIISAALDAGLVLINAGSDVIRFVPPLIATEGHIDEMLYILEELLGSIRK